MTTITYTEIKTALTAGGYPTSPGSAWQGQDQQSYNYGLVPDVSYAAGVQPDRRLSNYGIAYPAVLPAAVGNAVGGASYAVTIAATPLTGNIPLNVAATATETGLTATQYVWTWGDGTANTTTTVPTANHSYTSAGSYTISMVPTVNGVAKPSVTIAAPVVVSGAYSATLAGTPLTGAHPLSVTWTLTETNNPGGADSYAWVFGDGNTTTTTVPTATHSYAAAGSFTATVTPTINGVAKSLVTAAAPAVVS
jgi:PKD repeat protein